MSSTEIRFSGSGGQGLILAARILARALVAEGRNVAQSQAYEPVSRGGLSRSDLVVSDGEAAFPMASHLDYLLILDEAGVGVSDGLIDAETLVLVDSELVPAPPKGEFTLYSLPFTETARRLGNKRVANIVALGALAGFGKVCDGDILEETVKKMAPAKYARLNQEAFEAGRAMAG
jgi:2-oxoglutarate ferredoxin oxidoreductase subunit gamma